MRTEAEAMRDAIASGAVATWHLRKEIQFRSLDGPFTTWSMGDDKVPFFWCEDLFWRPAPTKRRIPFTQATVPKGALWRLRVKESPFVTVRVYGADGLILNYDLIITWASLSEDYEYSTDGGVTWHPGSMEVES